ncbi:hypothetical protein G6F40_015417 [Rhizopus arrhizus]|nr:hypothetical protein G6F40_015417 [Rhizopus arrhizus]
MGDHDDGLAVLAVELLQQAQDLFGGLAVEVAGGFVADQEGGVGDDRAGNRHALLLAAGQFIRAVAAAVGQADQGQRDLRIALALRGVEVGQQQRQLDVLLRGQHRHQVVELEHEADVVAAPGRQLAAAHLVDALAFDADLAAAGVVQAADQVEQGGLARTGGAHQRDEVAARDVQVDAVQHLHFLGATLVGLGDVAQ